MNEKGVGRVGKPTGLSQAEPASRLGPTGFDPSRAGLPLSRREFTALLSFHDNEWGCDGYLSFDAIAERSGLPRPQIRRTVRSLARKGYARYARGLWSEYTDRPAGSGYGVTEKGMAVISAVHALTELPFWVRISTRPRDSDGSPKGGDAEGGSVHDSAGRNGIAQGQPS